MGHCCQGDREAIYEHEYSDAIIPMERETVPLRRQRINENDLSSSSNLNSPEVRKNRGHTHTGDHYLSPNDFMDEDVSNMDTV